MGKSYLATTIQAFQRLKAREMECQLDCMKKAKYLQTIKRTPYTEEDKRLMQPEVFTIRVCERHHYPAYRNAIIIENTPLIEGVNNLRATTKVCPTCGKNHDEKNCITAKALSAAISRTTDPAY